MLKTMGGVVLAVHDIGKAQKTFEALFDTREFASQHSDFYNADITLLLCGTDFIGLASPSGEGAVADHLDRWGEGLFAAIFTADDVTAIAERAKERDVGFVEEGGVFHLDPAATFGLRMLVAPYEDRGSAGIISFIYEVTHLVKDWKASSDFLTDLFGLEEARFSPIKSDFYGYEGTLTLLDPPAMLDRIEVVTPYDTDKAMGRFFVKRGEGPYMFYTECDDMPGLGKRLDAAGARYAGDPNVEGQSLFIHPASTHGVLIGVSATNVAWRWSGRPELAETQR